MLKLYKRQQIKQIARVNLEIISSFAKGPRVIPGAFCI